MSSGGGEACNARRDTHLATFYRQRTPAPSRRSHDEMRAVAKWRRSAWMFFIRQSECGNCPAHPPLDAAHSSMQTCSVLGGDHALLKLSHISKPFSWLYVLPSCRQSACADAGRTKPCYVPFSILIRPLRQSGSKHSVNLTLMVTAD